MSQSFPVFILGTAFCSRCKSTFKQGWCYSDSAVHVCDCTIKVSDVNVNKSKIWSEIKSLKSVCVISAEGCGIGLKSVGDKIKLKFAASPSGNLEKALGHHVYRDEPKSYFVPSAWFLHSRILCKENHVGDSVVDLGETFVAMDAKSKYELFPLFPTWLKNWLRKSLTSM